jgi:hypothetical protein
MTEIVERLREAHANSAQRILGSNIFDEAAATIEAQAASLAAKDKEIEARDAFIKDLSDALIAVRPLGGSELFVQRFGQYYADPVYCKTAIVKDADARHDAMSGLVKHRRRAEQAERALAELTPVRDMLVLCGELGGMAKDEAPSDYLRRLIDEAASGQRALAEAVEVLRPFAKYLDKLDCDWAHDSGEVGQFLVDGLRHAIKFGHLRAARAFVAQHGSDSSTERK